MPTKMPPTVKKLAAALDMTRRIAKDTATAAPDMNPAAAPPAKEVEVIPGVKDVIQDRSVRLQLIRMTAQAAELSTQIRALEKDKKPLVARIKTILGQFHVGKLIVGDARVNYYDAPRKSIREDKLTAALLAEGLQPDRISRIIAAATTYSSSYTLKITAIGQEDEDE